MPSTAEFLLERLNAVGVRHVHAVPGDYSLQFCKKLSDYKEIEYVGCSDENHAGFAADAYARVNGVGAVCVTYNVGALKIANAVAGAFAERSPLIVISGSPGMKERDEGVLLHHMVRSFGCQKDIFENITCASTVLTDPNRAGYEIDRVLEALEYHKQPVYIELPRDIIDKPIAYNVYKQGTPVMPETDEENLAEAIEEVKQWVGTSKKPCILAGVQVARFGLGKALTKFAEKANIPIATTLLAKSVVSETHPLSLGVYAGTASQDAVQQAIEESDCLLMFGVLLTDLTLSFRPSRFEKRQIVNCSVERLKIKNHTFDKIHFKDFCEAMFKLDIAPKEGTAKRSAWAFDHQFVPVPEDKVTTVRFFEKIESILTECMAIVADVGDSMFGAMDLTVHHSNQFLSPAFYTSMGFGIPGALGVQTARPDVRPIVLVGDGAFQMSSSELSTIAARGLNPIVFVLNNNGYSTERRILDGPFNDIPAWEYHKFTETINNGKGFYVETEGELEEAIQFALDSEELCLINVALSKDDVSPALRRMMAGLTKKV